jgi:hypothetical protein
VSPTVNVNPTLFVIPCKYSRGLLIYTVAIIVTYQVIFIQFSIIHNNISSQVADKEGIVLANERTHPAPMTIFVHLIIRRAI